MTGAPVVGGTAGTGRAGAAPARAGLVLISLILVESVANLNLAVANVALPDIGKAFDSGQAAIDLIAVGFSLGLACSVLYLGALAILPIAAFMVLVAPGPRGKTFLPRAACPALLRDGDLRPWPAGRTGMTIGGPGTGLGLRTDVALQCEDDRGSAQFPRGGEDEVMACGPDGGAASDFDDPRREWRRLFSELLGTFALVLAAGQAARPGMAGHEEEL